MTKDLHTLKNSFRADIIILLLVTRSKPTLTNFSILGGPEIKIWDLLAGGRLLTTMSPHNKTVTSLGFASRGTRLMTSSLDRQVKFHNLSTFKTVHSVSFPSPVLTAAVSVGFLYLTNVSVISLIWCSKYVISFQKKRCAVSVWNPDLSKIWTLRAYSFWTQNHTTSGI